MKYMLDGGAYAPERAHFDDAGFDLRTPEAFDLGPAGSDSDQHVVDLKVHVDIPIGYCGKIESKSGLMVNHGVCCMGGVVGSSFLGTVKVRMINQSHTSYHFERGDKVAQMVVHPVLLCTLDEAKLDLSECGCG